MAITHLGNAPILSGKVIEQFEHDALHRDDHLYRNHDGDFRAGKDAEDAVIGDSHHQP